MNQETWSKALRCGDELGSGSLAGVVRVTLCRMLLAVSALLASSAAFAAPVVLHRGNPAEPDSLDPQVYDVGFVDHISRDMFLGLTVDEGASIVPGAAERWSVSTDGLTYVFTLRKELVWSDGAPLTADDVVFSFRRLFDAKIHSPNAFQVAHMKNAAAVFAGKAKPETLGVRAIDPRTVEMKLEAPNPNWLDLMAQPYFAPLPRHVVERFGKDWTRPENIVTSGAFTLGRWRSGDHVRLLKNPRYFEAARVRIDRDAFAPVRST